MKNCPNFECLVLNPELCNQHPGCEACQNVDNCSVCRNQMVVIDGTPLPCDLASLPVSCRFCEMRNSDDFDIDKCQSCTVQEHRNPAPAANM